MCGVLCGCKSDLGEQRQTECERQKQIQTDREQKTEIETERKLEETKTKEGGVGGREEAQPVSLCVC